MKISQVINIGKMPQNFSNYRSQFINLKLEQFIKQNNIKWPIDCVKLLQEMKKSSRYGIKVIAIIKGLSDGVDAATHYDKKTGHYAVIINRNRFSYPFKTSSDCRLNFTIAHEIGHIVLEHLTLGYNSKNKEKVQSYINDLEAMNDFEADEFAARLLMPEKLLTTFNYYSLSQVASWLKVSKSALIYRLSRLNRLDLLTRKKIKSCIRCGNIRFSMFAVYCGVCGQNLHESGMKGLRRIYYPDLVKMDSFKRCLVCINCYSSIENIKGDKCPYCQTSIFNLCSDETCSYASPAYARHCEVCGKPTLYKKKVLHSLCDTDHGHPSMYMLECTAGCGDTAASTFGSGMFQPEQILDCAGTASVLCSVVDKYVPDTTNETLTMMRSPVDGLFLPLAYINGGGMCIRWFRDTLTGKPTASYDDLQEEAEAVQAGSEGLIFIPHFSGRVLPSNPSLKGTFLGLDFKHTRGHMYRAIMESIAYEYKYYLSILKKLYPKYSFNQMLTMGGGAKSKLFNQIKADVLGVPVTTLKLGDTALIGSAVIAAFGIGMFSDYKKPILQVINKGSEYISDINRHKNYEAYAEAYLNAIEQITPYYNSFHVSLK